MTWLAMLTTAYANIPNISVEVFNVHWTSKIILRIAFRLPTCSMNEWNE